MQGWCPALTGLCGHGVSLKDQQGMCHHPNSANPAILVNISCCLRERGLVLGSFGSANLLNRKIQLNSVIIMPAPVRVGQFDQAPIGGLAHGERGGGRHV